MTYRIVVQVVGMGGACFVTEDLDQSALLDACREAAQQAIENSKRFNKTGKAEVDDTWRPSVRLDL